MYDEEPCCNKAQKWECYNALKTQVEEFLECEKSWGEMTPLKLDSIYVAINKLYFLTLNKIEKYYLLQKIKKIDKICESRWYYNKRGKNVR